MIIDKQGLALCSRYSFGPNSLHFCGPDRQNDLFGYITNNTADQGLAEILDRFETLYPYLTLIASQNNIKDPFDRRVVEAYWLGNRLLSNIKITAFVTHLSDTLALKRKIPGRLFTPMIDHMIYGGMPQHTFHVVNIFMRTGHHAITHTLQTMDSCRISWGKVVDMKMGDGRQKTGRINRQSYVVETRPLVYKKNKLILGLPQKKIVTSVSLMPKIGEWVSLHWGYVCDILTNGERINLVYYTQRALRLANQGHMSVMTI